MTIEGIAKLITDSNESLAQSVAHGFAEQAEQVESVETRLGQQINGLGNRIDALVDQKVSWDAHTRLADRVSRLETTVRARP